MKKGQQYDVLFTKQNFPMICETEVEDTKVNVKRGIVGQKARISITKKRKGYAEGRIIEILERSKIEDATPLCPHYSKC